MISARFPRHARLLRPAEFERVMKGRELQLQAPPLQILASANALTHARLGLVVGKRVAPRAVDRNRMRRLIRESFRTHLEVLPPVDIVVMQRRRWEPADADALRRGLQNAWRRIAKSKGQNP